jgi:hypothetical protein
MRRWSVLNEALERVDLGTVPVVSADRYIPRKERAALARRLFRSLGLPGISITVPDDDFVEGVAVDVPYRHDFDQTCTASRQAADRLRVILHIAFPNHVDDPSNPFNLDSIWSFGWR